MNKQQIANLLGAGTITVLVVALLMLFNFGESDPTADAATGSDPNTAVQVVPLDDYNALQSENDQLQEALQTMQDRELQYQTQLDAANNALNQSASSSSYSGEYEEYEDDDHEEYEHEEHEHEHDDDDDHDEYEHEDDDD